MNNLNHILFQNLKSFNLNPKEPKPSNAFYDISKGAWISIKTNDFLAKLPDVERPSTKKNDVETGEDLKSE